MELDIQVRPAVPTDYASLAAIDAEIYPEYPKTEQELAELDAGRDTSLWWRRWVAEFEGRVIGRADVEDTRNSVGVVPTALISVYVHPAFRRHGVGSTLYALADQQAGEVGLIGRRSWYREDASAAGSFLRARGFDVALRTREYFLAITDTPRDSAKTSRSQVEVVLGHELEWTSNMWQELFVLESVVNRDVPYPEDEYTARDLDQFIAQRGLEGDFLRAGYLLARIDGKPVGLLSIWRLGDAGSASIGLVGVLGKYRNLGIGRELVRTCVSNAGSLGLSELVSWVEDTNLAMQRIMEGEQFRLRPGWVLMECA